MIIVILGIQSLIRHCDDFIKDHPFLALIIFGVLTNLFTDVFKYSIFKILAASKILTNLLSKRLIKNALKGYELEYSEVKKLRDKPNEETVRYLYSLYSSILLVGIMILTYFIMLRIDPRFLYALYGASASIVFRIFLTLISRIHLMEKYFDFDNYERKVLKKIRTLQIAIQNSVPNKHASS